MSRDMVSTTLVALSRKCLESWGDWRRKEERKKEMDEWRVRWRSEGEGKIEREEEMEGKERQRGILMRKRKKYVA